MVVQLLLLLLLIILLLLLLLLLLGSLEGAAVFKDNKNEAANVLNILKREKGSRGSRLWC
jgi:hypothetical protein